MTDQHEKTVREFIDHANEIFHLSSEEAELLGVDRKDIEALTSLLDRNKALEDWIEGADHHPGCSGSYGRCKCGLCELKGES